MKEIAHLSKSESTSSKYVEKHVTDFLNEVRNRILITTDYKASYAGKRDYFVGRQFLGFPWKFVFVYKKNHLASIHIESYKKAGTDKISLLMDQYEEEMENEIGYSLELVPGSKNQDLLRLMIRLNYSDVPSLEDKVNHYVNIFIKFKDALEKRF